MGLSQVANTASALRALRAGPPGRGTASSLASCRNGDLSQKPSPAPRCLQLNLGEPELALASMEQVLQLQPGHEEVEHEISGVRAMVLRRQRSGSAAAGQRAHVVVPGDAAAEGQAAGSGSGSQPQADP